MENKNRKFFQMTDDEIKTLKKAIKHVKKLKIFKELEMLKENNSYNKKSCVNSIKSKMGE